MKRHAIGAAATERRNRRWRTRSRNSRFALSFAFALALRGRRCLRSFLLSLAYVVRALIRSVTNLAAIFACMNTCGYLAARLRTCGTRRVDIAALAELELAAHLVAIHLLEVCTNLPPGACTAWLGMSSKRCSTTLRFRLRLLLVRVVPRAYFMSSTRRDGLLEGGDDVAFSIRRDGEHRNAGTLS